MAGRGFDDVPRGGAAIVAAIEAQRAEIRNWAKLELRRLDSAAAILRDRDGSTPAPASSGTAAHRRRPKRQRRSPVSTSPAAMLERREAVFRFLDEESRAVAMGEISRALKLTPSAVTTALAALRKERRAARIGNGATTRYQAERNGTRRGSAPASREGTPPGRVLAIIAERGWASEDELTQALGIPQEQVVKVCATLVREGELEMARQEGRAVYVKAVTD